MLNREQWALVERHRRDAVHYAIKITRRGTVLDREEVDDAALDGLIKAAQTYRTDKGASFKTHMHWKVMGEVTHRERDKVKAVKVVTAFRFEDKAEDAEVLDTLPDREPGPEARAIDGEAVTAFLRSVAPMKDRQREAATLVFLHGLSLAEAGKRMGVCAEYVRQLRNEALPVIRVKMREYA